MEQLKQHWFSKILGYLGTFLLICFSTFALFFPQGSKFDMAKKIWFTYGFAGLTLGLFALGILIWLIDRRRIMNYELRMTNDGFAPRGFLVRQRPSIPVMIFLCGHVGWTVLSLFRSQTANFGYTEVLMLCGVALLFATYRGIWKPKMFYVFGNLLLIFSSIAGFLLYLSSHHQRAFGLFYDPAFKTDAWPNAFALFVLMLWPLLFHWFWKGCRVQSFFVRILAALFKIVGLGFVFATFILTFSRAGLICFVAQAFLIGVYGIISWWNHRKVEAEYVKNLAQSVRTIGETPVDHSTTHSGWKIVQLVIAVVLSGVLIFGAQYARSHYFQKTTVSFADKAAFANGEEVTSVRERLDFWKGGVALTKKEPLFGYGPMSFGFVYRSIQTDWLAIADHAHNIFLKISSESGIPASAFFLIFLLFIFGKAAVNFRHLDRKKKFILFILCTAFLGALGHNLVDYNLNFATNFIIFWMLLAMIDQFSNDEKIPVKKTFLRGLIFSLLALSLFSTVGFLSYVQGMNDLARIELGRKGINDGISYLPMYERSLFPRYSLLEQANWAAQNGKNDLALQYFQLHLKRNKWDALAYDQLGNFYEKQKNFPKAYENYAKALELDPKNFWNYYLDNLRLLQILKKKPEMLALSQKIVTELDQYLPKVKQNIHFTAQNGNSKTAIEVLKVLMKVDSKNRALFQNAIDVINQSIAKYSKA